MTKSYVNVRHFGTEAVKAMGTALPPKLNVKPRVMLVPVQFVPGPRSQDLAKRQNPASFMMSKPIHARNSFGADVKRTEIISRPKLNATKCVRNMYVLYQRKWGHVRRPRAGFIMMQQRTNVKLFYGEVVNLMAIILNLYAASLS